MPQELSNFFAVQPCVGIGTFLAAKAKKTIMKLLKSALVLAFVFCCFTQADAQLRDLVNAVRSGSSMMKSAGGTSGSVSENDGVISVTGNNHVRTFKMNGEKLEVMGNGHQITIKGHASQISVEGTNNVVTTDSVSKVVVNGVSNKVYYKTSPNKNGRASSSVSGVDSSAIKQK